MTRTVTLVGLAVSLAVVSLGAAFAEDGAPAQSENPEIILTGTLIARNGTAVLLATREGKLYTVDAAEAAVLLDKYPGNALSLRVNDNVRVQGVQVSRGKLKASRVQVFLTDGEAGATRVPAGTGVGPSSKEYEPQIPAAGQSLGSWRSSALVLEVRYPYRTLSVVTSRGTFSVDASVATIVRAGRTVPINRVSYGDVVKISGDLIGPSTVRADRIDLLGEKAWQDPATPLKSISAVGRITYIDYPSSTFKIDTKSGEIRVLADENTFIHFRKEPKSFKDLAVGQTVKVSAMGSLTSGYVASQVLIVGAPGEWGE